MYRPSSKLDLCHDCAWSFPLDHVIIDIHAVHFIPRQELEINRCGDVPNSDMDEEKLSDHDDRNRSHDTMVSWRSVSGRRRCDTSFVFPLLNRRSVMKTLQTFDF
jgi:hypothetical protein